MSGGLTELDPDVTIRPISPEIWGKKTPAKSSERKRSGGGANADSKGQFMRLGSTKKRI